jgi:undecaprenyl-diphosphatase
VIPLNALLKLLSGPTPLWSGTYHAGLNFPSGHVAFVTSVVGYLGWVALRRQQPAVAALALLVVLGMGPARVLVGAHLVSDVIAGYLVGAAVLVLALAAGRIETPSVQRSWVIVKCCGLGGEE